MTSPSLGAPAAAGHDVLLVGGSAGGVSALRELVAGLPADLPAAVLVVLHLPRAGGSSILPEILDKAGPLPVRAARSGDVLAPGQVDVRTVDDGHWTAAVDGGFMSVADNHVRLICEYAELSHESDYEEAKRLLDERKAALEGDA